MAKRAMRSTDDTLRLAQVWPTFLARGSTISEQFSFLCCAEVDSPRWGAWQLTYRVRVIDGELFIADLSIDPIADKGSWPRDQVTRALLGALPIDGLQNAFRVWLTTGGKPFGKDKEATAKLADTGTWREWELSRREFAALLDHARSGTRGRPYSRDDLLLRSIAEQAIEIGSTTKRGWLIELARRNDELAADGVTVSQPIKDAIRDCRQRMHYLLPTTQGSQNPPLPGPALMALWKAERDTRFDEWSRRLLTMNENGATQ